MGHKPSIGDAKPVEVGAAMWRQLDNTFKHVVESNGFMRHEQCAQLWAGFMAGAMGAMASDLGIADCQIVMAGVMSAAADVASEQAAH